MGSKFTLALRMRWGLSQWASLILGGLVFIELWSVTVAPMQYRGGISNSIQMITGLTAGGLLARTALMLRRKRDEMATGWVLLAAASWIWICGTVWYAISESLLGKASYPGVADIFYLSSYPLIMLGMRCMIKSPVAPSGRWNNVLDLGALGVIAAMLIWQLNLLPLIRALAVACNGANLLSIVYTIADFVTLMVIFSLLLYKSDRPQQFKPTLMLLGGVFFLVIADLTQGYIAISSTFASGSFVDMGWVLFGVFTGLSALDAAEDKMLDERGKAQGEILQTISTTVITNLWIVAGFSILVWAVFHPQIRSGFLLAGTGAACFLAVVRQIRMVGENTRLYQSLLSARLDLERKVMNRTSELATANATLRDEIRERCRVQAELERQRAELLSEIEERKRMGEEVEHVHRLLLDASRQAGMAEVATGVLHNVGNVLNSVNVSAHLVTDQLNGSLSSNLSKVAAMLETHRGDLSEFLTTDPRGRRIPEFVAHLSSALEEERAQNIREIQSLRRNVEHIKAIVATQQSYAKVAGVTEDLPPASLVDDALKMNEASLTRHGIAILRHFDEVPLVRMEKHKVLQILINLLHNARYALDAATSADKVLELSVRRATDNSVAISVSDNGIGIAPENLTRIFSHGFTTKKDGHGFGLHIGALAAKEMGGSLKALSKGLGQGATFVLELPAAPENGAANESASHKEML